jgi:hypothetical protein
VVQVRNPSSVPKTHADARSNMKKL